MILVRLGALWALTVMFVVLSMVISVLLWFAVFVLFHRVYDWLGQ